MSETSMTDISYQTQRRLASLETSLGDDKLLLVAVDGEEALSRLFHFRVEVVTPPGESLSFDKVVGQKATLRIHGDFKNPEHVTRKIVGLIKSVEQIDTAGTFERYELELVPSVWPLSQNRRCRIFQSESVPAILEKVLGSKADVSKLTAAPARNYCVQYAESDFDFALRLIEEEGYLFHFCDDANLGRMVIEPQSSAITKNVTLPIRPQSVEMVEGACVWNWRIKQQMTPVSCTLRDRAFQSPQMNLHHRRDIPNSVSTSAQQYALHQSTNAAIDVYEYPGHFVKCFDSVSPNGGAEQLKPFSQEVLSQMDRYGAIGSQRLASDAILGTARSNSLDVYPGRAVSLQKGSRQPDVFVVVSTVHRMRLSEFEASSHTDVSYENTLTVAPKSLPFIGPRATHRPTIVGHQTATVIGFDGTTEAKSDHIFTDRYGRVRIRFDWSEDEHNSCWVRVSQPWAGKGFGSIQIPRVGQEVVVGFGDGDPDCPLIYGSVYNGQNLPPHVLPDHKTRTGIMSCTNGSAIGSGPSGSKSSSGGSSSSSSSSSASSSSSSSDSSSSTSSSSSDDSSTDSTTETVYADSSEYSGMVINDKDGSEYVHIRSKNNLLIDTYSSFYQIASQEHATFVDNSHLTVLGGYRGIDFYGQSTEWASDYVLPFSDDLWSPVPLKLQWMRPSSVRMNFGSEHSIAGSSTHQLGVSHHRSSSMMSELTTACALAPATWTYVAAFEGFLSCLGLNVAEANLAAGDRGTYTNYRMLDHRSANSYTVSGVPSCEALSFLSNTVFLAAWTVYVAMQFVEKVVAGFCDIREGTEGREVVDYLKDAEMFYGDFLVAMELLVSGVTKIEVMADVGLEMASIAETLLTDTPVISVDAVEGIVGLAESLIQTADNMTVGTIISSFEGTSLTTSIYNYLNGSSVASVRDEYHYASGSIVLDADKMVVLDSDSCMHLTASDLISLSCCSYAVKTDYGTIGFGDVGFKIDHSIAGFETKLAAEPAEDSFAISASSAYGVLTDEIILAYGLGVEVKSVVEIKLSVDDLATITMDDLGITLSYGDSAIALTSAGVTITGTTILLDGTTSITKVAPTICKEA